MNAFLPDDFRYSSFVLFKEKLLFVETPKVASTWAKSLIYHKYPKKIFSSYLKDQSKMEMVIHSRQCHASPSLLEISDEEAQEVLTSICWKRVCFVRNPFARLFSCWRDKVFLCEPGFIANQKELLDFLRPFQDDPVLSFHNFVQWVSEKKSYNRHWAPYFELLRPDLISYTHFFKLESPKETLAMFASFLDLKDSPIFKLTRNESFSLFSRNFYNRQTAHLVYSVFQKDFDFFGYSCDSWRLLYRPSLSFSFLKKEALRIEKQAVDEIRKRNEVIAFLNRNDRAMINF